MEQEAAAEEIERLVALGAHAPGAPGFAQLAEATRRAGRAKEALAIAEEGLRSRPELVAGRIARALALLDLGETVDARLELERVLETVPDHPLAREIDASSVLRPAPPASGEEAASHPLDDPTSAPLEELREGELEAAFDEAQVQADEMVDANDVAEAAMRGVEAEGPEPAEDAALIESDSPFATETVAQLLADQGHLARAEQLRSTLAPDATESDAAESGPAARAGSGRVIDTLERWLENLRRDDR